MSVRVVKFNRTTTNIKLTFEPVDISLKKRSIKDKDEALFDKHCEKYEKLPSVLPAVKRIIAIGDIHGDYEVAIKCFKAAELINDKLEWIAQPPETVVVQVGDQIDRCRPYKYRCEHPEATKNDEGSDIKIMELFTELHSKAVKKGGAVYSLLGNHELMNVLGNMNYVSYKGLEQFKDYKDLENPEVKFSTGKEARTFAFMPGNQYAKFLGCTRQSAIIIGSCLFAHAGMIPEFAKDMDILSKHDFHKINHLVRKWLLGLINEDYVDKIVGSSRDSFFWTRVLGNIPANISNKDPKCEAYLKPVLNLFNIGHMIVGHTPQFHMNHSGINGTCNNKLWRVDNGASMAFSEFDPLMKKSNQTSKERKVQVLEILNDNEFNVLRI